MPVYMIQQYAVSVWFLCFHPLIVISGPSDLLQLVEMKSLGCLEAWTFCINLTVEFGFSGTVTQEQQAIQFE